MRGSHFTLFVSTARHGGRRREGTAVSKTCQGEIEVGLVADISPEAEGTTFLQNVGIYPKVQPELQSEQ